MDLKSLFYTIFKTLNPHNHQELSENKLWVVLKYYLFIILFSVIIMSLLFIPQIYSARTYVERGVEHFDNLTIRSEFSLRNSFNILSDPLIKVDTFKSNNTKETLVITPENIYYKEYFLFGKYQALPLMQEIDVVGSDRAQKLIAIGFFFILPSLLFWALIMSIVYFTMFILITYLVVIIISSVLRINVSMLRLLKMCLYASTIFILLQLLLMPFFRMILLPLILYWLLVIVVLFLWQDSMFKNNKPRGGDKGHKDTIWGSSKSKGIFDDANSHNDLGYKSSRTSTKDVRDSYEVDGQGNLKGSGKKHKNLDSENDGYVELK